MTFADGRWSMHQVYVTGPDAGTDWSGTGDYSFTGGRMKFFWSHEPGAWTAARVKVTPDGLTMSAWEEGTPAADNLALDSVFFRRWERSAG